ncbi:MAG: flagellar filament capping protein FliD, partial [candidate division Zixibacteria bacterium]|nr:flagellar filament capping protein FliD [candidate division Zixibacteria bacterium]
VNIDGYNTWTSGDKIRMTGTDTSGNVVEDVPASGFADFSILESTTVQELLTKIETEYGDVIAYVTSDGNIRVDDLTGGANLAVTFTPTIDDANSELDFGAFGAASARTREVIAGQDASITVDGVTVTDSSNIIDDVIEGVTLNLVGEDDGETTITITLNIEHDITAIKSNIQDFVDKYNNVMSYINSQFSYDEDSETTGGILFGDGTLSSVKSDLTSALTNQIWGVDSDFSVLSMIGIGNEQDADGNWSLSIDDDKLTGYLQTNFNDVMSLFVAQGVTSTSTLSYINHSRDSEADTYTVSVKRAATQGTETGSKDLVSSGIANAETLTITQGDNTAAITLSTGDKLADIKNAINEELDTEYTETLVGDQELKEDDDVTYITSETTWDNIFGTTLANDDVIEFSGTTRNGVTVSESYTISNVTSDNVQGLLSAIEDAFSSGVTANIDTSGRIVITDKYVGSSQLSLQIDEPAGKGLDFGTVDVTADAGDGSHEGRYAMAITATDDGSNHLVLRSDDYGNTSFTIDQDTTGGSSYDHIIYTTAGNTVKSTTDDTDTTVYITGEAGESSGTIWEDIYGATIE